MQRLEQTMAGKSVAIVGNAQSILAGDYGAEIDEHDVVVRINLGLTDRLPRDAVGSRTTLWATARYWPLWPCDEMLFMKLTKTGDRDWERFRQTTPTSIAMTRWPSEYEVDCKRFVGADPGTGIRLLWWLKTKCHPRIVQVYGMDCWKTISHWSGRHNTPNHSPELERKAMEKLL